MNNEEIKEMADEYSFRIMRAVEAGLQTIPPQERVMDATERIHRLLMIYLPEAMAMQCEEDANALWERLSCDFHHGCCLCPSAFAEIFEQKAKQLRGEK